MMTRGPSVKFAAAESERLTNTDTSAGTRGNYSVSLWGILLVAVTPLIYETANSAAAMCRGMCARGPEYRMLNANSDEN